MALEAIPTKYKGYTFRSRLEARWAVFFDALGIKWEYEAEGYKLSDGAYYLPDFWLPTFDGGMFAEVKPEGGDFSKAEQLCKDSGKEVWKCEGVPEVKVYEYFEFWPTADHEGPHPDFEWPHNGAVITMEGIPNADSAEDENRMFGAPGYGSDEAKEYLAGSRIEYAVEVARSARFEHV